VQAVSQKPFPAITEISPITVNLGRNCGFKPYKSGFVEAQTGEGETKRL